MDASVIGGWLVLPDRPDARAVRARYPSWRVLAHASGNPWLAGTFDHDELIAATVGSVRVAVIGSCPVTATPLTDLIAGIRSTAELDAVARALPGCWHLIASVDGAVRVQGSLSGVRRVFHSRVDGVPVAGDRADVLAALIGSSVDERALAVRVATGSAVPPPVGESTLWHGVRALEPDHYLQIGATGTAVARPWWRAPAAEVGLRAGADAVRAALSAAVAARRHRPGRLSADLSGGMDSTSLCFLAARAGIPDLLTFRWAEADVANDDALFAATAAARLPSAEHLVLPQNEMPGVFADPGATSGSEAPYRFSRTLARTRHNVALLAANGARQHLAGHGGDELFHAPPAYLHPLARRRPLTALRQVRGYRALGRWPLPATVAALADRDRYDEWWWRQARLLGTTPMPRRTPDFGWGPSLRVPPWVTRPALDTARTVLHSAGEMSLPLADDRGQHVNLAVLRMSGSAYRQLAGEFTAGGVRLEMPFLDDQVIDAALAVRHHERRTPWRYKPLLAEAMRPVLPAGIAGRSTKGEFGEDARTGLRRHLAEILDLFADSALAARGLIDPEVLRRALRAPRTDNTVVAAVEDLLGCETWLRGAATTPSGRNHAVATAS